MSASKFFMMLKPDAVARGLVGKIIGRFEKRGFVLREIKVIGPNDPNRLELITKHYEEHKNKSFLPKLITFMQEGYIIPMVWVGNLEIARSMIGATAPIAAEVGTIRGDYASTLPNNLIHCSDSQESAVREINIWYN